MLVDKPSWLDHTSQGQLRAISVQPGASRLATAGDDGVVRLWSLDGAATSSNRLHGASGHSVQEHSPLLALLHEHSQGVTCVRFSPRGHLLASSSQDGTVSVCTHNPAKPPRQMFETSERGVECWERLLHLRAHGMDVMDLSWSPSSHHLLATCSLDGLVCVWDVPNKGKNVATLTGHRSYVKGVAWDPIGTYLASQGDDKSAIVWSTSTWEEQEKLMDTLKVMDSTTYSTRLGWSPDGQYLALCNSRVAETSTYMSPIHSRANGFVHHRSFIGHARSVTVTHFNPCFFKAGSGELEVVSAVADSEGCITIWSESLQHARIAISQGFKGPITDLAWTSDGHSLFACSSDGTVLHLYFEDHELGERASDREVQTRLSKLYGNQEVKNTTVVQDPSLLELRERADQPSPSGKRRGSQEREEDSNAAHNQSLGTERLEAEPLQQNEIQSKQHQTQANKASSKRERSGQQKSSAKQRKSNAQVQKESRTNEGKRRITPQAIVTDEYAQQTQPEPPGTIANGRENASAQDARQELPPTAPPPAASHQPQQQQQSNQANNQQTKGNTKKKAEANKKQVLDVQVMTQSSRMNPPQVQPYFASQSRMAEYPYATLTLEVRNMLQSNNKPISQLSLLRSDEQETLWEQRLERAVSCASVCSTFAAAASTDGHLHIFTLGGRRLLPPLLVEDAPVFLDAKQKPLRWKKSINADSPDDFAKQKLLLLAVAANGQLYMWDLEQPKCILKESMSSVIACASHHEVNVANVRISHSGLPLAELENHFVYVFNEDIKAWACVADGSFLHSDFSSVLGGNRNDERGELESLQASAARSAMPSAAPSFLFGGDDLQRAETTAHLETLMAASLLMGKHQEHRHWLGLYARHLSRHELAQSFREVCETLAGQGTHVSTSLAPHGDKSPEDKLELLSEIVLPQAANGGGLQHLVTEFKEVLDYMSSSRMGENG